MASSSLENKLHTLQGFTRSALVSVDHFKMLLPEYSPNSLKSRLHYLVKQGRLLKICRGVWAFPHSQFYASTTILHLPALVRPYSINYLSLESVLSKYGVISQQMFDYATVMTTGREGIFKTPIGTLELTHTKRDPIQILRDTHELDGYPLREATLLRAYQDLKHTGRNLDLVDKNSLNSVLNEEKAEEGVTHVRY